MGEIDQISMKRGKIEEKILGEKSEKMGKSPTIPNLKNAQDQIITQGGFFSKNNKRTVYNKHAPQGRF